MFNRLKRLMVFTALMLTMAVCHGQSSTKENRDWFVLSVYPDQGVYQEDLLRELVGLTQSYWKVKDSQGRHVFSIIDSLATENTIVGQGDAVRFRRLIENRELTTSGIAKLKRLVNSHPVLRKRLVDDSGKVFHMWFKLNRSYEKTEKEQLLSQLTKPMSSLFAACTHESNGPLSGLKYSEWSFSKATSDQNSLKVFQGVDQLVNEVRKRSWLAYSVADLIHVLNDAYMQKDNASIDTDQQVEQLYMIAESLRSRHLHNLASPDLSRVNIVAIGSKVPRQVGLPGFSSKRVSYWEIASDNYHTLDCRA